MPGSNYYWSVQAVDTSFVGSPFASEHSFKMVQTLAPVSGPSGVPGDLDGDGVVSQQELAAVLANLDPKGAVDDSNFNLVLANYFPHSPWQNIAGLSGVGGSNLNFALSSPLTFSVLSSSNLINWSVIGTAVPRYFFTDTNAPSSPQRYYRLTYP
jgi:hypothetical protein